MKKYVNHTNYRCKAHYIGDNVQFCIGDEKDSNIRADLFVKRIKEIHLWGYIKSNKDFPISGAFLQLIEIPEENVLAETVTNEEGFYQFKTFSSNDSTLYKIILFKHYTSLKTIYQSDNNFIFFNDCEEFPIHIEYNFLPHTSYDYEMKFSDS